MKILFTTLAAIFLLTACTAHSERERLMAKAESRRELYEQIQKDDELHKKTSSSFAENERIVISRRGWKWKWQNPTACKIFS